LTLLTIGLESAQNAQQEDRMPQRTIAEFQKERAALNDIVMRHADLTIQRFFSLDTQAYREGALDRATKEMLGLVASLVLRCDDCIQYHVIRCFEEGVTTPQVTEALGVGLVVGGSIVIPHLRRAFACWEELLSRPRVETATDDKR